MPGTDLVAEQTTLGYIVEEQRNLADDEGRLGGLRDQLDRDGIVQLPRFLTEEAHATLRQQILDLESAAVSSSAGANKKYAIKGDALRATVVGELARSDFVLRLVNGLLGTPGGRRALVDRPIEADEIIPGINVMRGPGDVTAYHFDGTYLNLIFPVIIPTIAGARRGQLVVYPNIRSFKRGFRDRVVTPALARSALLRRLWRRREVDYVEGGLCLFYGYRSLHGVESPSEPGLRCITNMTVGAPRFR